MSVLEWLGLEVIAPGRSFLDWRVLEDEVASIAFEVSKVDELPLGHRQQQTFELVEHLTGLRVVGLETVLDVRVEVVEDLCLRSCHLRADLRGVLLLELLEGSIDVGVAAGVAEDLVDRLLEVETVLDGAEHLV